MAIKFLTSTNTFPEVQIKDLAVGATPAEPKLVFYENALVSGGISTIGGALVFEASSGIERARILSTGEFGIGTETPSEKLTVSGNILISDTGNDKYFGSNVNLILNADADENSGTSARNIIFQNRGSEKMRIDADGNVGIGTSSPSTRLEVAASATTSVDIAHFSNSNDVVKIKHALDGLGSGITSIFDASNNEDIRLSAQSNSWFNAGNVGIGTTSPGAKLDVDGVTHLQGDTFTDKLKPYTGQQLTLLAGNLNTLFIDGAVGIGTTSPTAPLHFGKTVYGAPSSENFFRVKFFDNGGIMNDVGIGQPTAGAIGWNILPNNTGYYEWNSGTRGRIMNLDYLGKLTLDDYDGTNQTGTPTYLLGTDASGNVVKTLSTPGGDPGPYLPLAGGTMTAGAVVNFLASSGSTDDRLKFGTSGQMQLFHDGSDGYIINSLGDVRMDVNTFRVRSSNGTETMIKATQNDKVELYYNDGLRIQTESFGASVYNTAGASSQAVLRVGGSESNQGSKIELAETLASDVMTFGFSLEQTGNGTNELLIKRHNNSATGVQVITLSRIDNNVSMSGGLSLALKATSSSTLAADSGTTLTTKNYVDAAVPSGGPFLPLDAGSTKKLTDTLYIQGTNSTGAESVLLRGVSSNDGDFLGSIRTANVGAYSQEMRFYTSDANGTTNENLVLTLKADKNASFVNSVLVNGTSSTFNTGNSGSLITNDSNGYVRISMTSASAQLGLFRISDGGLYIGGSSSGFRIFNTSFAEKFKVELNGDVTAQGTISATQFRPTNIVTNKIVKFNGASLDDSTMSDDGTNVSMLGNLTVGAAGGTAGKITGLLTAQITGDLDATNKKYVDDQITGGASYLGVWDPDVSLNSGFGNPSLSGGAADTGDYYVCSADGTATPNGTGVEPNSWNTGDWVIWNADLGASGLWQKIDNTTVLSGNGTAGKIPLWTNDETIGDSVVSQPNTTTVQLNNADLKIVNDLQTGGNGKARIKFSEDVSNDSMDIYYDGDGQTGDANYTSIFSHKSGVGDVLVAQYGGNVGIGTTTPELPLEVNGSILVDVFASTQTEEGIFFRPGFTASNKYNISILAFAHESVPSFNDGLSINGYDGISFCTGSNTRNERMRITFGGNVGIGTTNPGSKFVVADGMDGSNNQTGLEFIPQDSNNRNIIFSYDRSSSAYKQLNFDASDFRFNPDGSTKMVILNNGNVGIGITSPVYKLDVATAGGISAGGKITYSKSAGTLSTTGYAVAGLTTGANGQSAGFIFTCFGGNGYQRIVYSCINSGGTWVADKDIDEGRNIYDVAASAASGATITFTFRARSSTQSFTPRVTVEAFGNSINSTYA